MSQSMCESLGDVLKAQRKASGMTIKSLALKSGVHHTTVSRWERGKSVPFAYELTKVMEALGMERRQRQVCYKKLEAPRALQIIKANSGTLPVSYGELLRAMRQRARVPQRRVAQVVRVSQSLIAKWENDECWPDSEQVQLFCFAVQANHSELVFLTSRAWSHIAPLPRDKESLDSIVMKNRDDSDVIWSGVYFAFAARYQSLWREGRITEPEANASYGPYAGHLAWRFKDYEKARQTMALTLADIKRSSGVLSSGQVTAVDCYVGYDDPPGRTHRGIVKKPCLKSQCEENLHLLQSIAHRCPREFRFWYRRLLAQTWEKVGNTDGAEASYEQNVKESLGEQQAMYQRWAYIEFLCRQGRYQQAMPYLDTLSAFEPRPAVHIKNGCNYAEVFAGLQDFSEAQGYLTHAVAHARHYGLEHLYKDEFLRIGDLIRGDQNGSS